MTQIGQPITDASPTRQQRWMPLHNVSGQVIPGFALVFLDPTLGRGFFTQKMVDGQAVWQGIQPDELAESLQDPALLVCNGPSPIPEDRIGKCTRDWPAQVLHHGGLDGLPNGYGCGPKADSWYVWSGRTAFRAVSHDITRAIPGASDGVHTMWISTGSDSERAIVTTSGNATAAASQFFDLGLAKIETNDNVAKLSTGGDMVEVKAGRYKVSLSGTLYSSDATRGALLVVSVFLDGNITHLTVARSQDVEEDQYGNDIHRSRENVSVTGHLTVSDSSGDTGAWHEIKVRNSTSVSLTMDRLILDVAQAPGGTGSLPSGSKLVYP